MIRKTYKSNTNISINVVLPSKKNMHISFTSLSNGSSVFTTDNEEVQTAIEQHYKFGKLFKLYSTQGQSSKSAATATDESEKEEEDTSSVDNTSTDSESTAESEETTTEGKVVKVSDLAAAKDYLADTFGISRTVLRSRKAIEEQAAAHGIVFEGLS